MVLGLAVAMVGCQGAVGAAGDDGSSGAAGQPGQQGDPGQQGPQGFSALVAKERIDPLWVNDGEKMRSNPTIGTSLIVSDGTSLTLPADIDPKDFFFGGTDMVTYSMVARDWDESEVTPDGYIDPMSVFNVILKDGLLTIATRPAANAHQPPHLIGEGNQFDEARDAAQNYHYGRGTMFRLRARDVETNQRAETETIHVVRNEPPGVDTEYMAGVGAVTVGERPGFPAGATAAQKQDPCNEINVVCVDVANHDDTGDDHWFYDAWRHLLVFTPTPATDSAEYVSAVMDYDYDDLSEREDRPAYLLMVTGLKAGVDANGVPAVQKTEIEVIATDAGGLQTTDREGDGEAVWVVNVDPAPWRKAGVTPVATELTVVSVAAGDPVLSDVSRFFDDNNSDDLSFSAKIKTNSQGAIAVPVDGLIDIDSRDLVVVALSSGTADITITASEPIPENDEDPNDPTTPMLGQTATLDVTVTVKIASPERRE
jgi:hypothetical protein